jgi:hypothetical protein
MRKEDAKTMILMQFYGISLFSLPYGEGSERECGLL